MANTGWKYASSGRNINKGYPDWIDPARAAGASDGSWTNNTLATNQQGDELNVYNFSMSVPAGKQIDGIYVGVRKMALTANTIKDYTLYMMNDTTHKGSDGGDSGTYWPTGETWIYYGGVADLWGAAWTVDQVNASTFGVGLRAKNHYSSEKIAYVDSIGIVIYYSDPSPGNDHLMIMGM